MKASRWKKRMRCLRAISSRGKTETGPAVWKGDQKDFCGHKARRQRGSDNGWKGFSLAKVAVKRQTEQGPMRHKQRKRAGLRTSSCRCSRERGREIWLLLRLILRRRVGDGI
ncbi:hypothetical protein CLAIMM_01095 [Cladophialophora immunda]|nr:hypothetical protein CLAIMM_01095 [Cladophialophora immunda]